MLCVGGGGGGWGLGRRGGWGLLLCPTHSPVPLAPCTSLSLDGWLGAAERYRDTHSPFPPPPLARWQGPLSVTDTKGWTPALRAALSVSDVHAACSTLPPHSRGPGLPDPSTHAPRRICTFLPHNT